MRVVGILLARNEEFFVERAVRNTLGFCDEFIAVENGSEDRTPDILKSLEDSTGGKVKFYQARHPGVSHDLIAGFAGTDTWIFGVDGDEIYDPAGLVRLRARLEAGEFAKDWCIFGNVLNVRRLDGPEGFAEGYLAPPCRSMSKLYNFNAIEAWHGPCLERLHGGRVIFREGYHEMLRRDLHKAVSWEKSDFRCLHVCFLSRSSMESASSRPRKNIMDVYNWSFRKTFGSALDYLLGRPSVDWKEQRYGRGPLVKVPAGPFFAAEFHTPGQSVKS